MEAFRNEALTLRNPARNHDQSQPLFDESRLNAPSRGPAMIALG
jgi:hypothetical protein